MATIILLVLLAIIILLAVAAFFYFVSTQRRLVRLDENCKNALGQIEVQLNSRWDVLLALAKTASKYAEHESQTLINTIAQRRQGGVATAQDVMRQEGEIASIMSRLMAISEAYPDLKADRLYQETMAGVKQYEENVRMSRMVYNDTATLFNRAVRQWPSSFVANMLNFRERDYLKVDDESKRSMPQIFE
ncbi:MAG: LemA family protein [Muribaculaceae bacterium]|nr:LemA family protein [Muribaculaceae bacterium]